MFTKSDKKLYNVKGFTLIELIVVITILAIISSIAVPSYLVFMDNAKSSVCFANRQQLLKMFQIYLVTEDQLSTDLLFEKYSEENNKNICPQNGVIYMKDNKILCEIHHSEEELEQEGDGAVPYL